MSRTKKHPATTTRRFASQFRPPLDLQRVARAVLLHVEPMGDATYRVNGGTEAYYVSLSPFFTCDCGDAIFRESICKHQIAALYFEGDEEAVAIVAELRNAYRARRAAQRAAAMAEAAPPVSESAPEAAEGEAAESASATPEPVIAGKEEAVPAVANEETTDEEPSVPEPAERVVLGRWWR